MTTAACRCVPQVPLLCAAATARCVYRLNPSQACWAAASDALLGWKGSIQLDLMQCWVLQVKDALGSWKDVHLASNEVAILFGQTATQASAGLFRSATYRVVGLTCCLLPDPYCICIAGIYQSVA